jgi:hypothetical protein
MLHDPCILQRSFWFESSFNHCKAKLNDHSVAPRVEPVFLKKGAKLSLPLSHISSFWLRQRNDHAACCMIHSFYNDHAGSNDHSIIAKPN